MQNIEDNTRKLWWACEDGNIEVVVEILSNNEVDINGRACRGSPLTRALSCCHLNIVRRLLQHPEVDVNAPGMSGDTPLMWAVIRGCSIDIVGTLLEDPALQLRRCDNYGETALHWARGTNRVSARTAGVALVLLIRRTDLVAQN